MLGNLRKVESRVNFVVTKRQSNDQTVATTDRSGGPATLNGLQSRPSSTLNASESMIYGRLLTAFSGFYEPAGAPVRCQWRNLPHCWPHWQAVYYYFDRWKTDNLFERINAALNELDRKRVDRLPTPSLVCMDSQSRSAGAVKLSPMIGEERGLDPNKRVKGRKRQLVVDTEGRLWVAHVHAANEADGPAGCTLVSSLLWRVGERLEKVMGDQAYNGVFAKELAHWSIDFEKASRPESARGFVPIAKRWVVERTMGWTNGSGHPVLPPDR